MRFVKPFKYSKDTLASLPAEVEHLINNSYLNDKMKRTYLCIIKERIHRFNRKSE